MAFTLDFSQASNGTIKDGTYEAVIFNVLEDATPGGSEYMNFDMIVRNDVQQPYQNAHIFQRIWRAKATGKYNAGMINTIAQAANLTDGKSYQSLEELMSDFVNHPVKVTIKNEESDYDKKVYPNVKRWSKSDYPNVQHQFKSGVKPQSTTSTTDTAVGNEDLPF
ncbi:DUF669 domain-containing protein [Limosilactobacillus vaginalis]|uniref:DUF669 domain-containing protein n=1 Tax=Limosilactobacillus vaginalis TaxID=1633 RepID=UPI0022E8F6CF|nr:DUF669 domain-containing protein [Limosilactobacillus vaginalis]